MKREPLQHIRSLRRVSGSSFIENEKTMKASLPPAVPRAPSRSYSGRHHQLNAAYAERERERDREHLPTGPLRAVPPVPPPYSPGREHPRAGRNFDFCHLIERALDAMAAAVGGHDRVDHRIHHAIPALHMFATESRIRDLALTSRPSKFVFLVVILALVQTAVPVLEVPLDALAQVLFILFTCHQNPQSQAHPVPVLLTHLVITALRHLLPYRSSVSSSLKIPSFWVLLAAFGCFARPQSLGKGAYHATTVVEEFVYPGIRPVAQRIRALARYRWVEDNIRAFNRRDPQFLVKILGAGLSFVFASSLLSQSFAELVFRLTWWPLAVYTILTLDGLGTGAHRAPLKARNLLMVWSLRLILHAVETAHVPVFGKFGYDIISKIPVYYPAASMGFMGALYQHDFEDIRRFIEYELQR